MVSFSSAELAQTIQQIERERATGCISLEQLEVGYGLMQYQVGQLTGVRYAHDQGQPALEAIAQLQAPNFSFARGTVVNIGADAALGSVSRPARLSASQVSSDVRRQYRRSAGAGAPQSKIAWQRRIQTKVSTVLVLFTTLALAAFAVFNVFNVRNRSLAELEALTQTTAQQLSRHLSVPLWDLNAEIVAASIEAEMLDPRVATVLVRDEDGQSVFAGRSRDESGAIQPASNVPSAEELLSASFPIQPPRGEAAIGQVDVWVSPALTQLELQQAYLFEGLRVLILAIFIILITILLVRGMLINPITRLTESANAISTGQSDIVIDVDSRDEIGLLALSIKRMQASLEVAMRRLQQ